MRETRGDVIGRRTRNGGRKLDKSDTVFAKRGGTRYRSASVGLGRCAVWVCSGFRTRDARVCRGLHEDDGRLGPIFRLHFSAALGRRESASTDVFEYDQHTSHSQSKSKRSRHRHSTPIGVRPKCEREVRCIS